MNDGRWLRKKGGGWIIAVPAEVREWLRISHHVKLYWHTARRGEAVVTLAPARKAGAPDMTRLARELVTARAEISAIRKRDELRDRSVYAEGFAHGYMQAFERATTPEGRSAERSYRRKMWRWAFPEAASVEDPKQLAPRPAPARPRMNARTRRAKRDERLARRAVETYQLPEPSPCRVCGEAWAAHPKPDHAWATPPRAFEEAPTGTGGAAATPEPKPQALPVEK